MRLLQYKNYALSTDPGHPHGLETNAVKILLAEEDDILASVLSDILTEEGYSVRRESSRQGTLDAATSARWDCLLVDRMIPSHVEPNDGDVAFLHAIAGEAPVILLTSGSWAAQADLARLQVRAILRKPFDLENLLSAVGAVKTMPGLDGTDPRTMPHSVGS